MENILHELSTRRLPLIRLYSYGWAIFRKNASTFLGIVIFTNVVSVFLQTVIRPELKNTFLLCGYNILALVASLFALSGTAGVIFLVERTLRDEPANIRDCIVHGVSRFWAIYAAGVILILPVLILIGIAYFFFRSVYVQTLLNLPILPSLVIILLAVIGVGWIGYLQFAFEAAVLRVNGWKAAGYSIRLANTQWWSLFGTRMGISILWFPFGTLLTGLYFVVTPWNVRVLIFLVQMLLTCFSSLALIVQVVFFLNLDYLKNPMPFQDEANLPSATLASNAAAGSE